MRIAIDWTFEMIGNLVLFEDNHLLAMVKPTGMLTQADRTGDICLMDLAKRYLAEKYAKPGDVYLGLVHRLDRPVGGVIVFARTSKAAAPPLRTVPGTRDKKDLPGARGGDTEAAVRGADPLPGQIRDDDEGRLSRDPRRAGSAPALSRIIEIGVETSLVEVQLITGRKHQIRAQLAEIGCPIVGDIKYGAKQIPGERAQGRRRR